MGCQPLPEGSGNIGWTDLFVVEQHHLGVHFVLTAGDGVSQAQTTFTDARQFTATITPISPAVPTVGIAQTYTVTVRNTSSSGEVAGCIDIAIPTGASTPGTFGVVAKDPPVPPGTLRTWSTPVIVSGKIRTVRSAAADDIDVNGTVSVTFTTTASADGIQQWTVLVFGQPNCSGQPFNISGDQPSVTVASNVADQTISVTTSAPASASYGSTFGVVATGGGSGNPVLITTEGACSGGGSGSATITITSGIGTCVVRYNQAGNATFSAAPEVTSSTNATKAIATVTVNGYSASYDAAPHGATGTVTGVDPGGAALGTTLDLGASFVDYPGGTATWTFAGGNNYTDQTGTVEIVIGKAVATVSVNGYSGTYDAAPHGASGSVTGVDAGGAAVGATLDLGSSFINYPGGTATWTLTGGNNYTDQTGSVEIVIGKAVATVTVSGYSGTYDAAAHGATGSVTGVDAGGAAVGATLDLGSSFINYPGGTATWTLTGGNNYTDQTGSVEIVIGKAVANVTVTGYSGTYDAAPHGATGSVTGVDAGGAALGTTLDLGDSFIDYPGGTATWTFSGGNNYEDQSGTAQIDIAKAVAQVTVTGYSGTYDSAAHGATGSVTGVDAGGAALGATLDLGASFTNYPGGTATWTLTGGNNYTNQAGTAQIVIAKAIANVTVTGYYGTYDGTPHGATASVTGVDSGGAASGTTLDLGASFTDFPGGSAAWAFNGGVNYTDQTGTVAIVINKATPTVTVTFGTSPITFDGDPHPAIVTVMGVGGPLAIPGNGTTAIVYTRNTAPFAGVPTLVGSYTAAASFTSTNVNYTNASSTSNALLTILTACSTFNGFLSPIGGAVENRNTGGSLVNPVRSFKLNSTIPVKFSATCFDAPLLTGIHTLRAIKYSNAGTADAPIDASPTDAATTGNQFRLSGTEWHFNLSTKAFGAGAQGIWLMEATLFDGSTYSVWIEIKK